MYCICCYILHIRVDFGKWDAGARSAVFGCVVDRALPWEEERESMGEAEEERNSSRMSKKHRIGGQCIERGKEGE